MRAGTPVRYLQDQHPDAEVQTDKAEGKVVYCRGCKKPLIVNAFYAAARASCEECGLPRQHAALLDPDHRPNQPRRVTEDLLIETAECHPGCRCEELGLAAGLEVEAVMDLEGGCTGALARVRSGGSVGSAGGYVCPRLNEIRRNLGK